MTGMKTKARDEGGRSVRNNGAGIRQAVILAAGRGSRMGHLTESRPKCLCEIAGRPLLAWTLASLRANGIERILVLGGWLGYKLAGWGDMLRINARWGAGGMVRTLQCAADWLLQEPTLVVYGDGAYGSRAIAAALQSTQANAGFEIVLPVDSEWLRLWTIRFNDPLVDAESLERDGTMLRGIGEPVRDLSRVQGQFMGLLRIAPSSWRRIESMLSAMERASGHAVVDRMDTTAMLRSLLIRNEPVRCVDVDGGWVEIDSPADLRVVEEALKRSNFVHDFRR
jgi:choline kinase